MREGYISHGALITGIIGVVLLLMLIAYTHVYRKRSLNVETVIIVNDLFTYDHHNIEQLPSSVMLV